MWKVFFANLLDMECFMLKVQGFEQKEKDRSIVLLPFAQKDFLLLFLNNFIGELEKPDNVIKAA